MELSVVEEDGVRALEGQPGERFLSRASDASRIVEAGFTNRVDAALLYSENLTDRFFDLSSGEAGAVLQTLRNYGVRLAVVCPPGAATFSSRFGEALAEERMRAYFGVFETRAEARAWLARVMRG